MELECVWEGAARLDGRDVEVGLWSAGATGPPPLAVVEHFIAGVAGFDRIARAAMLEESHGEESAMRDYLDHHREDLDPEAMTAAIGTATTDAASLLTRMRLVSIGLYPGDPVHRAVFDYTTGREFTDNLIAVRFDAHDAVTGIAMES
ncbi:DUF2004 domain-containing protein [Dactylosporangium sp. CA-233914]|uniref:DUF2004 domain-containing protein n=1 Tax=Dactylosporangium sp. CA-233914 TaxID=3239934 RepID=UPI003D8CCBB1